MSNTVLNRIAQGDKAAVDECLKNYGGLVWSLARRMLNNKDEAEDAAQEIFIDIWKNAARFDETLSSETTFIAMIARRRLIDRIRKYKKRVNADSLEEVTVEPQSSVHRDIQLNVEAKQAAEAMTSLRPQERKILQLSIFQGLSHSEISSATGMPLGTVKTHARRGLSQVRKLLGLKEVSA